jgi:hypothetical protein
MMSYNSGRPAFRPADKGMTLYVFHSGGKPGISAFTASGNGVGLPEKLAPWTAAETIMPKRALPHGLSRKAAEEAVRKAGYALWRIKESAA